MTCASSSLRSRSSSRASAIASRTSSERSSRHSSGGSAPPQRYIADQILAHKSYNQGVESTPGHLLREARRRHGVSQARLAIRAGTTQSAISRIERDQVSPTVETLRGLLRLI